MAQGNNLTDAELIVTLRSPGYESGVCRHAADRIEALVGELRLGLRGYERLEMELVDMQRQRDGWKAFALHHPELTPPVVTQELVGLRDALNLATAGAKALHNENSDLRALLAEARSHNPERYRSSSDDSGTHGAETGDALLPSPSSDWTHVAPSGEGSGQPVVREGWCPHCGTTKIEDYSGGAPEPNTVRPTRRARGR